MLSLHFHINIDMINQSQQLRSQASSRNFYQHIMTPIYNSLAIRKALAQRRLKQKVLRIAKYRVSDLLR